MLHYFLNSIKVRKLWQTSFQQILIQVYSIVYVVIERLMFKKILTIVFSFRIKCRHQITAWTWNWVSHRRRLWSTHASTAGRIQTHVSKPSMNSEKWYMVRIKLITSSITMNLRKTIVKQNLNNWEWTSPTRSRAVLFNITKKKHSASIIIRLHGKSK